MSSNESRKAPFRPLLPEVEFLQWDNVSDLERIDDSVACVVVETVQGDAGIRIPSAQWLGIEARCKATEALFILDEIQCGMGRTGTTWAFELWGCPDVLCMGKALGAACPLVAWRVPSLDSSPTRLHWAHHHLGGHPMACAGVVGAFEALGKVDRMGFERQLASWEEALVAHRAVRVVRRIGAFIAVELEDAHAVQRAVNAGLTRSRSRRPSVLVPQCAQRSASPHLSLAALRRWPKG